MIINYYHKELVATVTKQQQQQLRSSSSDSSSRRDDLSAASRSHRQARVTTYLRLLDLAKYTPPWISADHQLLLPPTALLQPRVLLVNWTNAAAHPQPAAAAAKTPQAVTYYVRACAKRQPISSWQSSSSSSNITDVRLTDTCAASGCHCGSALSSSQLNLWLTAMQGPTYIYGTTPTTGSASSAGQPGCGCGSLAAATCFELLRHGGTLRQCML